MNCFSAHVWFHPLNCWGWVWQESRLAAQPVSVVLMYLLDLLHHRVPPQGGYTFSTLPSWPPFLTSPFQPAGQSLPGLPPPAGSLWPWCAGQRTLGTGSRNVHPAPACTCCSWWASSPMGSACAEPASCLGPRKPGFEITGRVIAWLDRAM